MRASARNGRLAAAGPGSVTGSPAQLRLARRVTGDGRLLVTVTGELDIATAGSALSFLNDVIDDGAGEISVDVGGLTFCDAAGLSVFARSIQRARTAHQQLRLISVRPQLHRILAITGMDRAFPETGVPAGAS